MEVPVFPRRSGPVYSVCHKRSPGYRRRKPLSCVRVSTLLRGKRSPAAVSPSSVSSFLRRSVFYPLASPLALPLAAAPRFTFACALALSLCYTHMSPLPAPGCICMGGNSPCFSWVHCGVLRNPLWRNFPCPRECGFLPLPLVGDGTCLLVHRG